MSVSDNMSYDDVITIGDVKANGPKINVGRLRDLATAGSSLRLFEVSDEDMAKSLQSMTQQKDAKKTHSESCFLWFRVKTANILHIQI